MKLTGALLYLGTLTMLAGALAATYTIFAFAGLQLAISAREVPTPDLRGLSPKDASRLLDNAGLTARIEPMRQIHPAIESGLIAQQEPQPGTPTRRRRNVKLWLSSGPNAGQIPSLIGESRQFATRRLTENTFTIDTISEIRSSRYPTDTIVSQEPPPSSSGDTVSLLVNRGERGTTYVVPDLMGVNGESAAEILRERGFRVTVVGDHPYPGVPSGVVIRQAPGAGYQTAQGESISLEVSR